MGPDLYLAFTTGLLGGFGHCIGMCGPLVAALNWRQPAASRFRIEGQWVEPFLYHTGGVTT